MNGLRSSWNAYQDQDAASSDDELPAKGKATFKERSAAVGREAALQKQLQEAARDRQDLAKRYEAKDQKCNELRDKLKVTKAALASRERELEMAQRMLTKLGQEKTQLREENADSKVYTRKLEARLEELKGTADLSIKYHTAKQKAQSLQQQLVSVNAELEACKDAAALRSKEVERLNRALDIRASELSQEAGGQDIPAKLLHSLAESREESLELAKQLAATKSELNKLKASASRLAQRLEAAELMRADAEVAAEQLRQRLEKLVGSSQEVTKQRTDMGQLLVSARSEAETYRSERDELAEVVLEMQEEIEALRSANEAAQTRGEVAAAAAADQAMQHIATSHAAAEDARQQQAQREAQLNQRCSLLAQQSAQLEAALQQQLTAAQQSAAARQQQILVLESQLQTRRQRELDLERQVASLQAEADKLGGAISSVEAAASRSSQLEHQVVRLEASLRVADVERQQLEQRLQQMVDDAVAAQQEAQREMDGLRVQLASKEAAYRCALEDIDQLQKQLNKAMDQLDRTSNSKAQLQHNMLHQISSIKEKLQQAELHSQQQLLQPTSPIFRNRGSSTSTGLRASHSRSGGTQAAARSSSMGQIDAQPQMSMGDVVAAAALDAARRVKAGPAAARRSLGSQMRVPGATAAASGSVAAAPSAQHKLARHSIGCIGNVAGTSNWQQQQHIALRGSSGRMVLALPGDTQLANAAVNRVTDCAASLHRPDNVLINERGPGAAGAVSDTVPGEYQLRANKDLRGSQSAAVRAGAGPRQFPAHIPPITISSYAGSTGFAEGDLELDQEVGYGVRSAAVMHLASPPGSRRRTSSGGGAAAPALRASCSRHGSSGRTEVQQQQQQLLRHSSAGLADELGGENIDWHSILQAADMPSVKIRSTSPSRPAPATAASPAAAAGVHIGDAVSLSPGAQNCNSPYTGSRGASEPVHDQYVVQKQQQQQQQQWQNDARASALAVKRCASVPPQLQTLHVPGSASTTGSNSKPAAAGGLHSSCSWLQQPVEPYSPSVAPAAVSHAQQGSRPPPAAAGTAKSAGRGNDIADPYSLPGSAEPSATSLQSISNGGAAAVIAAAATAAGSGSMRRSSLDRGWQQQQQVQQQLLRQHVSGAAAAAHQSSVAATETHGNRLTSSPSKQQQQQQQHHQQQQERLTPHATTGKGAQGAAAGGEESIQVQLGKDASSVLHACGAWEVNLYSDSCSTDHNTTSDSGDSRSSSHSGQHAIQPPAGQQSCQHTAGIKAAGDHHASAGSPQQISRLEASKAALRGLTSRSRQVSTGSAIAAGAAQQVSETSSTCSTDKQGQRGQSDNAASAYATGSHPAASQQRTPPPQTGGLSHGGLLITPPSTKRMQQGTVARANGLQPVKMQELMDTGALRQQQQQRARSQSGGSSKLHHDPSLSSWNGEDDIQDTGRCSSINNPRLQQRRGGAIGSRLSMPQQQQQQHGACETAEDHSIGTLEDLLAKLNEGTLQDLVQLEGLM